MRSSLRISIICTVALAGILYLLIGCSDPTGEVLRSPHPQGWSDDNSPNFHGDQVADLSTCAECHGTDYTGGSSQVSCYTCHSLFPHPIEWSNVNSSGFHGSAVSSSGFELNDCEDCHFEESTQTWSCWSCHVYFPHAGDITSSQHGGLLASMHYQVWLCQTCHGSDYSGGSANVTCLSCHTYSPEACNTCHGTFSAAPNDTSTWAPPPDVQGNTNTSLRSVGAHQQLVNGGTVGGPYSCNQCHILPNSVQEPTHLDTLPPQAEIHFGDIATEEGELNPIWNPQTATCTNTYCHGNFEFGNPNNSPAVWTNQNGSQTQCGTCHGLPPTNPDHPQISDCSLCHSNVVNQNYQIIAPWLHVNGAQN
ncbi:MAG: CxxxxCH/CxxCH domain-containing protein [bacterium]